MRNQTLPPGALWWMGGASLLILFSFKVLAPANIELSSWNHLLLILFSFPHFALSFFWFFGQKRLRDAHPSMTYALPVLLVLMSYLIIQASHETASLIMIAGLLVLYWHFAKQAFGCALWISAAEDNWRSGWRRKLMLSTCLSVASYGFIKSQSIDTHAMIFRFYVTPIKVSPAVTMAFAAIAAVCGAFLIASLLHYSKEKPMHQRLAPALPIFALYAWVEPKLFLGGLSLAPVFHGLQFIPFPTSGLSHLLHKSTPFKKTHRYLLIAALLFLALILGWLLFDMMPRWIAPAFHEKSTHAAAATLWSLNMLHFMIDSVSWRRPNSVTRVP